MAEEVIRLRYGKGKVPYGWRACCKVLVTESPEKLSKLLFECERGKLVITEGKSERMKLPIRAYESLRVRLARGELEQAR